MNEICGDFGTSSTAITSLNISYKTTISPVQYQHFTTSLLMFQRLSSFYPPPPYQLPVIFFISNPSKIIHSEILNKLLPHPYSEYPNALKFDHDNSLQSIFQSTVFTNLIHVDWFFSTPSLKFRIVKKNIDAPAATG